MNRTVNLAAAVAAVLGTGTAFAQVPTLTAIEAVPAANTIYIAGSSAAKNGVLAALEATLCGGAGNYYNFSSGNTNTNFFAVSCVPVAAANAKNTGVYNIFYRDEGGSVTGMLPIVNQPSGLTSNSGTFLIGQESQLALSAANITANACAAAPPCTLTVTGASSTNGVDDSFGPATGLNKEYVDIGIADVEPAALTGNNYPTPYSTGVWGPVNQTGLVNLAGTQLFDEVYGLFVNENSSAFIETPLNLSVQTLQQIMTHHIVNWSLVTDANGAAVTNASVAITIVNREKGSGSRTATDLLIAGDACTTGGGVLFDKAGATDYFSTGNVLTQAAAVVGAITYATIDQVQAPLTQVTISGIAPGNLATASGAYPFWVEATYVQNPLSSADSNVMAYIESSLSTVGSAPHLVDVLGIPGVPAGAPNTAHAVIANSASAGGGALGAATIYVNPFTRGTVTCNAPSYVATAP
jgi:hypothetical protein